MTGRALILRGDAAHIPMPDASVDLIVTSPPFYALRSYTDGGVHYDGQIGSEATPAAYIDTLTECTAEWARVLKPGGSMFVDLGDKYAAGHGGSSTEGNGVNITVRRTRKAAQHWAGADSHPSQSTAAIIPGLRPKSLMLLPERYRIAAVDRLGLTCRAVIIWQKVNGLPESVTDRVRRSHEDWVHLTRQPRYYSAVDEIREPHARLWDASKSNGRTGHGRGTGVMLARPDDPNGGMAVTEPNPLGKLPGSVWTIPTEPLQVPAQLGVDHFAAYPTEWPRRLILGWSPPGICTSCGEGRRPAVQFEYAFGGAIAATEKGHNPAQGNNFATRATRATRATELLGYVCACTPHTDHPGTGEATTRRAYSPGTRDNNAQGTYGRHQAGQYERVGSWRDYHLDQWTPPPTVPAVVLDPFGGTGTTALVAKALGRIGISVDMSADYSRLAAWRTTDPGELAKAMRVPKPEPVGDDQMMLFDPKAL
jgi:DNA modification methylase